VRAVLNFGCRNDYNSRKSVIEACRIAQRIPTATTLCCRLMRAPTGRRERFMVLAINVQYSTLDLPTLSLVAVCIAGLLGVFLIIDWMQQRNVRALAWWGSAYLIGASAMALASMPTPLIELSRVR
jgi:hypothetical protein